MTALDYIINGLEAELVLQRELGVRFIECDRSLVLSLADAAENSAADSAPVMPSRVQANVAAADNVPLSPVGHAAPDAAASSVYDFVFLHDKPLSAKGALIISKICHALNKDSQTAPLLFEGELPQAKVYVVLGGLAMRKWFPAMNSGPGSWEKAPNGIDVLVTYSPEYLIRFESSPSIDTIKRSMWLNIKSIMQRVAQ